MTPHFSPQSPSDRARGSAAIPRELPDIRYRLGQAYVHTGQKDKAQEEFTAYQKLREQHLAEIERQRAEIRQFIYSAKNGPGTKPQ